MQISPATGRRWLGCLTNLGSLLVCCSPVFLWGAEPDLSKLPKPSEATINFDTDVKPIIEQNCIRCHGPERPKSHFRLNSRESALKGGDNGIDIIVGDSAKSPLIHYVSHLVEGMEMPRPGKGEPLSAAEVGLLRAWIDQGASYGKPWESTLVRSGFSISPSGGYTWVKGNEHKFREHFGREEGWNAGVADFQLT